MFGIRLQILRQLNGWYDNDPVPEGEVVFLRSF